MADKKKKAPLGERLNAMIRKRTGAQTLVDAFENADHPIDPPPTPSLSPKRRPENMTNGIFDQGKYERNKLKKKK